MRLHLESRGAGLEGSLNAEEDMELSTFDVSMMILRNMFDEVKAKTLKGELCVDLNKDL